MTGDGEELPLYAGPSAGLTQTIESGGELVETPAEETLEAFEKVR